MRSANVRAACYAVCMSLRSTLSEFTSAVKDKVGSAFGEPDVRAAERELEAELARAHRPTSASTAPSTRTTPLDEATARQILRLSEGATLDEVRAAAMALGRQLLSRHVDDADPDALDRAAAAAELLEERLLPLASSGRDTGAEPLKRTTTTTTTMRSRATPRR